MEIFKYIQTYQAYDEYDLIAKAGTVRMTLSYFAECIE